MGFSAPKPDPKIAAMQESQAAQAKRDKISVIQDQLSNEDQLRARLYGAPGKAMFGGRRTQMQGGAPLVANLYGAPGLF
jgi:signal recognition particle receptor subunit beta